MSGLRYLVRNPIHLGNRRIRAEAETAEVLLLPKSRKGACAPMRILPTPRR